MTAIAHLPDGHEAYRDDAEYTAPEMQPGNGEDIRPESWLRLNAAALTFGTGGGALAGESLREDTATPTIEHSS